MVVVLIGLQVFAFVDVARTEHHRFERNGANKGMTFALLILAGWIGTIYWFAVLRRRVRR